MLTDPAAERAVIASVILGGGSVFADVSDIVNSKSFSIDSNQALWACLERICTDEPEAKIDYPTIMSAANGLGLTAVFDKPEERQHLRSVMNMPVQIANVRKMAAKVKKLEIGRLLDSQLDVARAELNEITGDEPIDAILSKVESPIFDFTTELAQGGDRQTKMMGDGLEAYFKHLMDNPREMMGISTGYPRFDMAIGGGLRPNSLDMIAARPKSGKSFCVDNIALNIAYKQNIHVLNLDTEMSWEEHGNRVGANLAGIPIEEIEKGNNAYREKLLEAGRRLKDKPYAYRCVLGEEFEESLAHMRRWVLRTVGLQANGKANPCVVIYDYLKLMSSEKLNSGNLTEWQMLGFIATSLKNFAGRYGVPILGFAQLNREMDIAASDRIKWFCTSYSTFRWKDDEELAADPPGPGGMRYTHALTPELCRRGKGLRDGDYINMAAQYHIGRIVEGPTRRELEQGGGHEAQHGIVVDVQDQEPIQFN